jgi:hypothetical protein
VAAALKSCNDGDKDSLPSFTTWNWELLLPMPLILKPDEGWSAAVWF